MIGLCCDCRRQTAQVLSLSGLTRQADFRVGFLAPLGTPPLGTHPYSLAFAALIATTNFRQTDLARRA